MDPNELLKTIRALTKEALEESADWSGSDMEECLAELAQAVSDLDDWISSAGFLPEAWKVSS